MAKAKKTSKKSSKKSVKKSAKKPVKTLKVKRLPKKELDVYKKLLFQLRSKISGDLQQIEGDTLNGNQSNNSAELSDVADIATDNYDRELNIGFDRSDNESDH